MKHEIFAILDMKVEAYHKPFFANSEGEAKRMIIETAKDEQTTFHKYPEDFQLFHLGNYNDSTAKIESNELPILLGNVLEIYTQGNKQKSISNYEQGETI